MQITQWALGDATVLELHGALTAPATTELLDAVRKVTRTGPRELILDLEDVPSIDAAGLGTLVTAYSVVRRVGGTLRLARVARRVQTLLVVGRLITILQMFDSVEDAVADGLGARSDSSTIGHPTSQLSQASLDVIQHFLQRA